MENYTITILSGVFLATLGAIIILILISKNRKDNQRWAEIAEDNYHRGKDEASEIIRATYDKIEEDKSKIAALSDRELMTEILLALASYGRRIDRIDSKLKCITNYKAYIDDMNAQTNKLTQSFLLLEENTFSSISTVNSLKQTIQETNSNIHKLIEAMGNLSILHSNLAAHVSALNSAENTLSNLQTKISGLVTDMNAVLTTYDQAPMKKLKAIEVAVGSVINAIEETQTEVANITVSTNRIQKTLHDSMEEYDYGSLFYRISDITSSIDTIEKDVSNMDDEIRDISNKVYDVKNIVERSLGCCGNSIEGQLDDIESKLNSLLYK